MTHVNVTGLTTLALLFGIAFPAQCGAQESAAGQTRGTFATLDTLNASYEKQFRELEARRIADLAALAQKTPATQVDAVYRELFGLAITHGLCTQAMEAARRCLDSPTAARDARSLAALVRTLGHAENGEHDRALSHLQALFQHAAGAGKSPHELEEALGVGEAFLARLIREGRYDLAHQLCKMACGNDSPTMIKDHFEDIRARLELVGKPAPRIAGNDIDGKPFSLDDLKGKVVLVDFWATWCPPCTASIPHYRTLTQKFGPSGFVILGVNVDAMHEDAKEARRSLQDVRRFLVTHRVDWTNMLNGEGAADFASAYHVERIPANFLIGPDGRILDMEQNGQTLERAVARALSNAKSAARP